MSNEVKPPKKQRRLIKKKRAGEVLTRDEVRQIKKGRKKLRKEMREMGLKKRKDFEMTASSIGLYFDKNKRWALFWEFFKMNLWWLLLSLILTFIAVLFAISYVTQLRGHFTISLSNDLFREGFTIAETPDFKNKTGHLFATFAENVPCISVIDIPNDVDNIDGSHNGDYFAYTFYVRNEGENPQDLKWTLNINSESKNISSAAWVMLFIDGELTIYAEADEQGNIQCLPAADDNNHGYLTAPMYDVNGNKDEQYEVVATRGDLTYWRIKPKPFMSHTAVDTGLFEDIPPNGVHKFTVVIWLEGDDPHCTDELIGGHFGMDFFMEMPILLD